MSEPGYRKVGLLPKVTNLLSGRTRIQRNSGFKDGSPHHQCSVFCAWVHVCTCVHCVCMSVCVHCVCMCARVYIVCACVHVCTLCVHVSVCVHCVCMSLSLCVHCVYMSVCVYIVHVCVCTLCVHVCTCVHCVCVSVCVCTLCVSAHACVHCASVSVCTYLHHVPMCVRVCVWAWVYVCWCTYTCIFHFRRIILNVHPALCFVHPVLSWRLLSQYISFSPVLSNCWNNHHEASSPSRTDRH